MSKFYYDGNGPHDKSNGFHHRRKPRDRTRVYAGFFGSRGASGRGGANVDQLEELARPIPRPKPRGIRGADGHVRRRFHQGSHRENRQGFRPIAILVNNAGITKDGLAMRMKKEDWDNVIA